MDTGQVARALSKAWSWAERQNSAVHAALILAALLSVLGACALLVILTGGFGIVVLGILVAWLFLWAILEI